VSRPACERPPPRVARSGAGGIARRGHAVGLEIHDLVHDRDVELPRAIRSTMPVSSQLDLLRGRVEMSSSSAPATRSSSSMAPSAMLGSPTLPVSAGSQHAPKRACRSFGRAPREARRRCPRPRSACGRRGSAPRGTSAPSCARRAISPRSVSLSSVRLATTRTHRRSRLAALRPAAAASRSGRRRSGSFVATSQMNAPATAPTQSATPTRGVVSVPSAAAAPSTPAVATAM
jgi:hypothetical protein